MKCAVGYKGVFIINHFLSGKSADDQYLSKMEIAINKHKEVFSSDKYNFDFFITTYQFDNKMLEKLDTLSPKSKEIFIFDEIKRDNNLVSQLLQHINVVKQIKEYENANNIRYDLVIMTRLDLEIYKVFNEMDIDFQKFNIVVHHKSGNCDDNLWIFPRKYLDGYEISLKTLLTQNRITHELNHELVKNGIDIHFMDKLIDSYMGHNYFSFIR